MLLSVPGQMCGNRRCPRLWSQHSESDRGPRHYESLSRVPWMSIRASIMPMLPTIPGLSDGDVGKNVGKDGSEVRYLQRQ